ncbi:MAG: hypothetical protein KDJ65_02375 [Anaerolineae bacterium]|nr:hypothetical protein [Anaerolineae bacterium]
MRVHESYESETWGKIHEPAHIQEVLDEIEKNFPKYFTSFWKPPKKRMQAIQSAIEDFLKRQPKYADFLDVESLEEYEFDPGAFKTGMKTELPIIQGALFSQDQAMKQYKASFYAAKGMDLLSTTKNIIDFAVDYMADFDDEYHELLETVADFERSKLQEPEFFSSGVIGEGIKAHFLYSLHPNAFPNRGQNAIWSLYFLTSKKEFDFLDGSEFLMIDAKKGIIQQNYLYPYDLFSLYALKIYLILKQAAGEKGYPFTESYRYIYLDHFFGHIAQVHQDDISVYKTTSEDSDYGFH